MGDISVDYLAIVAEEYGLSLDELVGVEQKNLTPEEKELKEAIDYLRYVAVNWFARERIEDLSDEEIIKIANFIKKVEARNKTEK